MRIKMITTMANDRQTFLTDEEYDVVELMGVQAIRAGIASEIKPPAPKAEPKAKPEPKPEPKPAKPKAEVKPEAK